MSDFTFGLWTLDGVRISPIVKAFERKTTLPFNGLMMGVTRTSLDDPVSDEILDRDGDVLLTVHQGTTVRFVGELMTAEEVTRAQENKPPSLMCTFAGPLWKLKKRLIGTPYPVAPSAWTDLATDQVLKDILLWANADDASTTPPIERDTGIRWNDANPTLFKTTIGIDPKWLMKPASEALTELQEAKIPFPIVDPPTFVAKDSFEDDNPGWDLHTTQDELGNTWIEVGGGPANPLIYVDAGGRFVTRDAGVVDVPLVNDFPGAWAIAGTGALTHTLVGIDWWASIGGGGGNLRPGVFARCDDQIRENYFLAFVNLSVSTLYVYERIGGVTTSLGSTALPTIPSGIWHGLRLLVDEAGNYTVWHYSLSDAARPNAPVKQGRRSELAVGGALQSGLCGFHDEKISSGSITRYYDNFVACDNTDPQSFDFSLTPVEPGTPGDPRKIATLDLAFQMGVERPNAIFEYGDGSRSAKDYTLLLDRQYMTNRAYSLDPSGGTDIRTASDPASIALRGEYAEVIPSEFSDASLRQALVESHVAVRKGPRRLIDFSGSRNAPVFGVDYDVGDWVVARSKRNGRERFSGYARVYSVEISIDDLGNVEVIPTLVPA